MQLDYADTAEEAADRLDAVLLLTEWAEYRDLDQGTLGGVVAQKRVLDGRNALDRATPGPPRDGLTGPPVDGSGYVLFRIQMRCVMVAPVRMRAAPHSCGTTLPVQGNDL